MEKWKMENEKMENEKWNSQLSSLMAGVAYCVAATMAATGSRAQRSIDRPVQQCARPSHRHIAVFGCRAPSDRAYILFFIPFLSCRFIVSFVMGGVL